MNAVLRILIVDDEQPARERMRELLGDCAAQYPHNIVGECANGYEALAALSGKAADLVLVDINMPQMSGMEFARHALNLPDPPALVFVTAHDQYAVQAFEVNALDYLLKPVRATRLAAALHKRRMRTKSQGQAGNCLPVSIRIRAATFPSPSADASCWCRWQRSFISRPSLNMSPSKRRSGSIFSRSRWPIWNRSSGTILCVFIATALSQGLRSAVSSALPKKRERRDGLYCSRAWTKSSRSAAGNGLC